MTGYLAGEGRDGACDAADIFVFPSTTETVGNGIIEAKGAGLPLIVADEGGPKELVREGETGLITKARDPVDFAQAIRRLLADDALREAMGAAARATVENRSWPSAFRKFWAMTELT